MGEGDVTNLKAHAEAFVNGKKSEWGSLVEIAIALEPDQLERASDRLAKLAGIGKATVKRKIEAIRFKFSQGWTVATIIRAGQSETISSYVKLKTKARTEPLVAFPHRLTPGVRDALEELCIRLAKVLKMKSRRGNITYDDVFEFMCGHFATMDELELQHDAGMVTGRDKVFRNRDAQA